MIDELEVGLDARGDSRSDRYVARVALAASGRSTLSSAELAPPVAPVELAGFRHVSEREPGPWICCAPCSGAMVAAWAIGTPATLEQAHLIRRAVPKPHAGGMRPSELRAGVLEATGLELRSIATDRDAIASRLVDGWAIAVPLWYGRLPRELRRWSPDFTGGHMAALAGVDELGRWGWWDPLAPPGWRGEYIEPSALMPAAWDGISGAQRGDTMAGIAFTMTDPTPGRIRVKDIDGVLALQLADRQAFPFPPGSERDTLGLGRCGENIGGSGSPLGYLIGDELAVIPAGQVDFTPSPDDADAARLEGARAEWDRWHSSLGIPPRP